MGILILICQNQLAAKDGNKDYIVPICCFKKWLAHFVNFDTTDMVNKTTESREAKEQAKRQTENK